MKILYAIQATGNGHISRANELIPYLELFAEVDLLVSGTQANMEIDQFVKFRRKGLSFVCGKNGGIDLLKTLQQLRTKKFLQEVKTIPVTDYDFVLNDFEPLSAWACKLKNIPCIAMSHQFAVIGKAAPRPPRYDPLAWLVLRYYAPSNMGIGFHFKQYDMATYLPVIRAEIRNAYLRNLGHYTVYLPAYEDKKLVKLLSVHKHIQWHIFSRKALKSAEQNNCWIRPVNNFDFISSFTTCEGVICGAGFETPAEALFMNKKLLAIPMKGQYEQGCNAAALEELGVKVLKKLSAKKTKQLAKWLADKTSIQMDYPDHTLQIVKHLLASVKDLGNALKPPLAEPETEELISLDFL
ncbi:MAG: glycosyltransferase-distantly-related protein [Ferruginibacter sp.]|nr:glycosyltransferase-distantly-related protein [Ferruginibacter sp.]